MSLCGIKGVVSSLMPAIEVLLVAAESFSIIKVLLVPLVLVAPPPSLSRSGVIAKPSALRELDREGVEPPTDGDTCDDSMLNEFILWLPIECAVMTTGQP